MKDRKKFLIISIIAAVILILIVVAALFFLTDIFKNNKEIFNKYLAQSGSQLVDQCFIKTYINANIREFSEIIFPPVILVVPVVLLYKVTYPIALEYISAVPLIFILTSLSVYDHIAG